MFCSNLIKHYSHASHISLTIYGVITPHASRSSWRDPYHNVLIHNIIKKRDHICCQVVI
jgi:hypothetical protein